MKRWIAYELAAVILALGGVLMFGLGLFLWKYPIQFRFISGWEYLVATLAILLGSIVIMRIAWRLSQEAQKLKEAGKRGE